MATAGVKGLTVRVCAVCWQVLASNFCYCLTKTKRIARHEHDALQYS